METYPLPDAPGAAGDDAIASDGTNMGTRQEAEARFLEKVNQWRKAYEPAIDTAAGHKRRTINEHEARFQLAGASAHLAWFMENAPATSRIRDLEEANQALREALENVKEQMSEAVHVAFRKGSHCREANVIWQSIKNMPPAEWSNVINFILGGFEIDKAIAAHDARGQK